MNNTGELIKAMRVKAGFTQNTLADALHITDRAISKWERGYSLPDIALLPKLSVLLDVDIDMLISQSIEQEEWIGLINIEECDLSQKVYDKPLIYYILSHYLLLGINRIHVLTKEENKDYLSSRFFSEIGIQFSFEKPKDQRAMIIDQPWFLFGSDLTHQFKGAMMSGRNMRLIPENQNPVFFFAQNVDDYFADPKKMATKVASRTLGRGMICFNMSDQDSILDVASFVRTYQKNSGLLIGCIEEIVYRRGNITNQQLLVIAEKVPYGNYLRRIAQPQVS